MNNTTTPRTDAVASFGCVRDDFARQLERELAKAREILSKESTHACNLVSRLSDEQEKTWNLKRELAEMQNMLAECRKEAERFRNLWRMNRKS